MKDVNIGCKHIISIKNFSQLVIIIISSKAVWRKITSYNRSYIVFIGEREENLPLNHVHFHQAKPADQLFKKTKHINKLHVFLHLYVIIKSSSKIYNYLLFCKIVQKWLARKPCYQRIMRSGVSTKVDHQQSTIL